MKVKLTDNKEVYNFCEPYIIAELGANHNGDMELAERLIFAAKDAGADCVKFQSWSKNSVFSKTVYKNNFFLNDDYRDRDDYTLEEIVEKFSISEEELMKMKIISEKVGIDCISTPISREEADFLADKLDAPFIKVASMDLNNYPFLEYLAKKKKPMVISTGFSKLDEIEKAVRTIENAGNDQLVILHCIATYPPEDEDVNLNNIETLQKLYPYPIGFSDHSIGFSIPLASVVKGACIIEKHLTLDKSMFGWDHKISATPDELKVICTESKKVHKALGTNRIIFEESNERKEAFRRSIVTKRDIKKGDVLTIEMLDFKRPGTGIEPGEVKYVLGRRLNKNIAADELILWEDLL